MFPKVACESFLVLHPCVKDETTSYMVGGSGGLGGSHTRTGPGGPPVGWRLFILCVCVCVCVLHTGGGGGGICQGTSSTGIISPGGKAATSRLQESGSFKHTGRALGRTRRENFAGGQVFATFLNGEIFPAKPSPPEAPPPYVEKRNASCV